MTDQERRALIEALKKTAQLMQQEIDKWTQPASKDKAA